MKSEKNYAVTESDMMVISYHDTADEAILEAKKIAKSSRPGMTFYAVMRGMVIIKIVNS